MQNNAMKEYRSWLEDPYYDSDTKEELKTIAGNTAEIEDRFGKDLEFGTGGMRSLMGAGTNRLNAYTVRRATQGLANYILEQNGASRGVVISFDSRHHSTEFAEETALCLNANGIRTYRFESLRPTPELSFAVRELGCIAGVAITASHNPSGYNGYKVYWEDGGQITPPHDRNIMKHAAAVHSRDEIKTMTHEAAVEADLYKTLGTEIDERYYEELLKLTIDHDVLKQEAENLRIVYTPLNGCGNIPVRTVLERLGIRHVKTVASQEKPDGDFPTCPSPNPEEADAWICALETAKEYGADIVIATDPDSDRLGVQAKDPATGEYVMFNGNMTGVLMEEYILSALAEKQALPKNGLVMSTIVSSPMGRTIAEAYGCGFRETLTGFKYIGEQMRLLEDSRDAAYVYGYEESYGCLYGDYVRDKDAQSAVVILSEMAAACRHRGITLTEALEELYRRYGYWKEGLMTVKLKGQDGIAKKQKLMDAMRTGTGDSIGGKKILAVRDYKSGLRTDRRDGSVSDTGLPVSDVVYYELEDGWCCARPSGTEPKVKFYFGVNAKTREQADEELSSLKKALEKLAE